MALLLLMAAGIIGWLWYSGKLGPDLQRKLLLGAVGLAGAWLTARGQWVAGLALVAGASVFGFRRQLGARVGARLMAREEAREILGVGPDAGPDEIRRAHRRIIAQVHPDKGGTAELARRVNMARDRLLND